MILLTPSEQVSCDTLTSTDGANHSSRREMETWHAENRPNQSHIQIVRSITQKSNSIQSIRQLSASGRPPTSTLESRKPSFHMYRWLPKTTVKNEMSRKVVRRSKAAERGRDLELVHRMKMRKTVLVSSVKCPRTITWMRIGFWEHQQVAVLNCVKHQLRESVFNTSFVLHSLLSN